MTSPAKRGRQTVVVSIPVDPPLAANAGVVPSSEDLTQLGAEALAVSASSLGVSVASLAPVFTRAHKRGSHRPANAPHHRRFYRVNLPAHDATALIERVQRLEGYDAHPLPEYRLPLQWEAAFGGGPAPTGPISPDFSGMQTHLEPAPRGVDARYAWTQKLLPTDSTHVRGADIEYAWLLNHEDYAPRATLEYGVMSLLPKDRHHGTACIGAAVAMNNHSGVIGVAPDVSHIMCFAKEKLDSLANVIDHAWAKLSPGDVLLVELEVKGPAALGNAHVAPEFHDEDLSAIKHATEAGIVVVLPAGNSGVNLDDPALGGAFSDARASDAIVVGAGLAPVPSVVGDRSREGYSNYGRRVNVQGYGNYLCTTGGGDLQGSAVGGERRWYTAQFNGTSSAAAMVWGVCLMLQGIVKQHGGLLTSREMRDLLVDTGSAQTPEPGGGALKQIGPRPNMRAAIEQLRQRGVIP